MSIPFLKIFYIFSHFVFYVYFSHFVWYTLFVRRCFNDW
nr:MAG TPA: hypothetical protein [Caudoviricetes sp.]